MTYSKTHNRLIGGPRRQDGEGNKAHSTCSGPLDASVWLLTQQKKDLVPLLEPVQSFSAVCISHQMMHCSSVVWSHN